MIFTDQALAKRLEAAEAYNGLKSATALALGLGMDGPLSASDADRMLSAGRSHIGGAFPRTRLLAYTRTKLFKPS